MSGGVNCDGIVCCLGCLSLVPGLRRRIVSRVAFYPPRPAGYWIDYDRQAARHEEDNSTEKSPNSCIMKDVSGVGSVSTSIFMDGHSPWCLCLGGKTGSSSPRRGTAGSGRRSASIGRAAFLWDGSYQRMPTTEHCDDGQQTLTFDCG
eukprot:GHVQ01036112.1.p1 GENE.GHVQ01036112.1~~GHVQ01036112.1.p1  ORF type:complete len:148 (+),score=13.75 GHVQ01036112.1:181-624(+)